jgi:hypothetical protein
MNSKLLREAARGILLVAETGVLLIGDGLGALIELLDRPAKKPGSMYLDIGVQTPYTLSDLEAMRSKPQEWQTNSFAFRAEPWTIPHLPDCLPMQCAEGCGHMHPLATEIALAPGLDAEKLPEWVKAAAKRPYVTVHSDGCSADGCVPGCKVMREKADRLAHAGYGNAFEDNLIRDDEETREADPVKRAHATISRIVAEVPAEVLAGDEELRCKHSRRYCESVPGVCCSDCSHGGDR